MKTSYSQLLLVLLSMILMTAAAVAEEPVDFEGPAAAEPAHVGTNGVEATGIDLGPSDTELVAVRHGSVLDDNDIILYYGHPLSRAMGILGEMPIDEMAAQLHRTALQYDAIDETRGVIPGFHIVYATVYPEGEIGIIGQSVLQRYIDFAEAQGMVVVLDHQLGRHDVVESVRRMLPLLHYRSVHFGIDPEWSTDRPNEVIGSVTADEINEIQRIMQEYMIEHSIPGRKMLLVHQFHWRMIENRVRVRADFERIDLIHNADGFGPPKDKHASWRYNVEATNMPLKGFKLFYPKEWRSGGYDDPLMTPREVFELEPRPVVIQYQ